MKLDVIQKAFLRGYKTGQEALNTSHSNNSYKIGQILEDGFIYAGQMITPEKSWHIALAPEDYYVSLIWNDANRSIDLPTKDEWSLISINKNVFGFKKHHYYWTSTESCTTTAWGFFFDNGHISTTNKIASNYVRCVRRF